MIRTSSDLQTPESCMVAGNTVWNYTFDTSIFIRDSMLKGNSAACPICCGGGLWLAPGGNLTISNTSFVNNNAGMYGGGTLDACLPLLYGNSIASSCSRGGF